MRDLLTLDRIKMKNKKQVGGDVAPLLATRDRIVIYKQALNQRRCINNLLDP